MGAPHSDTIRFAMDPATDAQAATAMRHRDPSGRLAILATQAIASIAFLAHGVLAYGSAGRDDAHITYAAANALARTGQILNLNGVRLEQSTSLLHVILLAAAEYATGGKIADVGGVFSIVCGLAGLLAIAASRTGRAAVHSCLALLVSNGYFAYWSFGGLETSLVSLVILCGFVAAERYLEGG